MTSLQVDYDIMKPDAPPFIPDDAVHHVHDPVHLDLDPTLLAQLTACRVADRLPQLDRAARHTPAPLAGWVGALDQENAISPKNERVG
jgi:hypothetical protein